jgi:hypothetical protein
MYCHILFRILFLFPLRKRRREEEVSARGREHRSETRKFRGLAVAHVSLASGLVPGSGAKEQLRRFRLSAFRKK